MGIEIQTDTYEQASDILNNNKSKLNSLSEDVTSIAMRLEGKISNGIKSNLLTYSKNIKDTRENIISISNGIINKVEEYREIESKTKNEATSITYEVQTSSQNQYVTDELYSSNADLSVAAGAAAGAADAAITTQSVLDGYNSGSAVESVDEVSAELTATGAEVAQKSETFWQKIGNFFKRTGAAIGNLVTGILQGIGEFVEAVVDTCALIIGGVCSIVTGLIDGFQAIRAKITGDDNWSSTTKALWNNGIMKFVQHTYVKDAFNSFHENTGFGKWLDNNAWNWAKSDGIGYKIADGIGYIAPIIVLTIVTFGAGGAAAGAGAAGGSAAGAAAGGAAAATTGASMTISSQALAAGGMAAFAGFGKNTEYAWNDGASALEGLGYGAAKGLWEGAEMTLGYGINSFTAGIGSGLGKQVIDSSAHVLMDAADAASGSLVDPLFQMIYNPNEQTMDEIMNIVNYDENGNQINNYTWDDLSFQEKYNALFKRNGGWATVGTNAAFGAVASALSEVPEIVGAFGAAKAIKSGIDDGGGTPKIDDGGGTPKIDDGGGTPKIDDGGGTPKIDDGGGTPPVTKRVIDPEKVKHNEIFDSMTEEQRSIEWENYFKEQYGDGVEHTSGITVAKNNGSHQLGLFDSRLANVGEETSSEIMNAYKKVLSTYNTSEGEFSRQAIDEFKELLRNKKITTAQLASVIPIEEQLKNGSLLVGIDVPRGMSTGFNGTYSLGRYMDSDQVSLYLLTSLEGSKKLQADLIKQFRLGDYEEGQLGRNLITEFAGIHTNTTRYRGIEALIKGQEVQIEKDRILKKLLSGEYTKQEEAADLVSYLRNQQHSFEYSKICTDRLISAFEYCFKNGDSDIALHNLEALAEIRQNPKYMFTLENGTAYVSSEKLVLDTMEESLGTSAHEFGHLLHRWYANDEVPINLQELLDNAMNNSEKNKKLLKKLLEQFEDDYSAKYQLGLAEFDTYIKTQYGSMEGYIENIRNQIKASGWIEGNDASTEMLLKRLGISDDSIKKILKTKVSEDDIIYNARETLKESFVDKAQRSHGNNGGPAVSDITAAIYRTRDVKGVPIHYAHDAKYFTKNISYSFYELMANYNQLLVTGNKPMIDKLKSIFGTEIFDEIDRIYRKTY